MTSAKDRSDGVVGIIPARLEPERPMLIVYNGPLAKASEISAHVGFNQWKDVRDYKMVKTLRGFELSITPPYDAQNVGVCFKDSAGNWDNNNGDNYNYSIST